MTRTRTVLTALTCTSVLALGACSGDDPEPKFSPTQSVSPSSSTSPTTTPPSPSDREAAFIESYFGMIDQATRTGMTSEFMSVSDPACANCRTLAHNIESAFADDGHVEGSAWVVSRSAKVGQRPEGSVWQVDVKTAREHWYDGSGSLIKTIRASTQRFGVIVGEDGGSLQIKDLRVRS